MFVALGNQHATCMYHNVIYGLPALQYFSTLSHKKHYLKKMVLKVKCVLIFSTMFEIFLSLRIVERDMIHIYIYIYIYIGLHVKCSLFLSASMKLEFYGQILKNTQLSDVIKMLIVGV